MCATPTPRRPDRCGAAWACAAPPLEQSCHLAEQLLLERVAGGRIADDADFVAVGDLGLGQIAHVPEYAADGRAEAVDDSEFRRHGSKGRRVGAIRTAARARKLY